MQQTGFFHHIGTFLLFSATILLIVTDISSPVVNDISMLKVVLANGETDLRPAITFGTFGYCITDTDSNGDDFCSRSAVGYSPAEIITAQDSDVTLSTYAADTSNALTKVMILHPIATGLAFIAFLLALGAGVVGSFLSALVAGITFIVTLVVLITDFVAFSIIKNAVNDANNGSFAEYGSASWTILVSAICSFLGMIIVFFTCCSARLHHRRHRTSKAERWDSPPAATTRRRWF